MLFSKRASQGLSDPNALTKSLEKKRGEGVPILDLSESNPSKCAFAALDESLVGPLSDKANLRYEPDPRGLLGAREAVAAYYAEQGIGVHPERIFLTAGTSEAYSHLFHILCDPGDSIMTASPGYPLVDSLAEYAGVAVERFGELPSALSKRTKALLFVNPANPTGGYIDEASWKKAGALGAAVISDEVFFDFDWRGKKRTCGASRNDGLHFTMNGVSKMLGLPQMKLAWTIITGPEELCRGAAERFELISDSFLSVNTPSQNALPAWLKNRHAFIAEVKNRVRNNFETLRECVGARRAVSLNEPEGGWYATMVLPPDVSDEAFVLDLLEKEDVLVHPGYFFDFSDERIVVSLLPEPALFREGAQKISRALEVPC
jgi:alanine-synthesizing transaminase